MDRSFLRLLPIAGLLASTMLAGCGDPDSRAAKYVKHGEELMAQGQPDKARQAYQLALDKRGANGSGGDTRALRIKLDNVGGQAG